MSKDSRDIREEIEVQVRMDPNNPSVLLSAAVSYAQVEMFAKAAPYAEQALSSYGRDPYVLMSLAPIFVETGEVDRGIGVLEKALSLVPESGSTRLRVNILHNLKVAYLKKGDRTKARGYFDQAQEIEARGAFEADLALRCNALDAKDFARILREADPGQDPTDAILETLDKKSQFS